MTPAAPVLCSSSRKAAPTDALSTRALAIGEQRRFDTSLQSPDALARRDDRARLVSSKSADAESRGQAVTLWRAAATIDRRRHRRQARGTGAVVGVIGPPVDARGGSARLAHVTSTRCRPFRRRAAVIFHVTVIRTVADAARSYGLARFDTVAARSRICRPRQSRSVRLSWIFVDDSRVEAESCRSCHSASPLCLRNPPAHDRPGARRRCSGCRRGALSRAGARRRAAVLAGHSAASLAGVGVSCARLQRWRVRWSSPNKGFMISRAGRDCDQNRCSQQRLSHHPSRSDGSEELVRRTGGNATGRLWPRRLIGLCPGSRTSGSWWYCYRGYPFGRETALRTYRSTL